MTRYIAISNMLDIEPLEFGRVTVKLYCKRHTRRYWCKAPGVCQSYGYSTKPPDNPYRQFDPLADHKRTVLAVLQFIDAHESEAAA